MKNKFWLKYIVLIISLFLLLGSAASGFQVNRTALAGESAVINHYLPIVWRNTPWTSPFGVEIASNTITADAPFMDWVMRMPTKSIRLNTRISWRLLQPNVGDPIQWDLLTTFENELRVLRANNITPIIIVNDYPAWATTERSPGVPSYCGPLQADKYGAFAAFVSQIADRYKAYEFNVHIWELGNEPDVDGAYFNLPDNTPLGCWGDVTDLQYYGGYQYGLMLRTVGPAIKAADPLAQVWVGGLLLDSPNTTAPGLGHPEFFLKGIYEAGVGTNFSYFDVVPYHAYSIYQDLDIDYDNGDIKSAWYGEPWGGVMLGKAKYIRDVMALYGTAAQKPMYADEVGLICPEYSPFCNTPSDAFFSMQAYHLVRSYVRGLSTGVTGFTWYTLDGPGWRYSSLLDETNTSPRPAYLADQTLTQQLINADYFSTADYGPDFEAYVFRRSENDVHIVWSKEDLTGLNILVPASKFVEALSIDGTLIAPVLVGDNYQIPVGFSPVFVTRRP